MDFITGNISKIYSNPMIPFKGTDFVTKPQTVATNSIFDGYNTNLITQHVDGFIKQNKPAQEYWRPQYSPAGFNNYDNMLVRDAQGNIVQEVKFSKKGNTITQTINVNSVDGSKFSKVLTQNGNKKTMDINVKDKLGNILVQENRTYERLDDDTAISTRNGVEYKISGLKGNVITVEHEGKKEVIDFNQKIFPTTEKLDQSSTGKNITDEQKEFLISRIKNRPGDLILTLANEIDKFTFMDEDGYEGWYCGYKDNRPEERNDAIRILKTCRAADNMLELHELGHGVNEQNNKSGNCWSDLNLIYRAVREKEINDFHNNMSSNDYKLYMQKFTNGENMLGSGMTKEECKLVSANEEFAETFGFYNNMDIENVNFRTTSLIQYMPASSRMAYNASKLI